MKLAINSKHKWKRRFCRYFSLSIQDEISLYWLHHILFADLGSETFFTNANHVADVYRAHLPNFNILLLTNENCKFRYKYIFNLLVIINRSHIDYFHGITVFANVTSPWFIRLYRKLHPNRRIILRFHDILGREVTTSFRTRNDLIRMAQ